MKRKTKLVMGVASVTLAVLAGAALSMQDKYTHYGKGNESPRWPP